MSVLSAFMMGGSGGGGGDRGELKYLITGYSFKHKAQKLYGVYGDFNSIQEVGEVPGGEVGGTERYATGISNNGKFVAQKGRSANDTEFSDPLISERLETDEGFVYVNTIRSSSDGGTDIKTASRVADNGTVAAIYTGTPLDIFKVEHGSLNFVNTVGTTAINGMSMTPDGKYIFFPHGYGGSSSSSRANLTCLDDDGTFIDRYPLDSYVGTGTQYGAYISNNGELGVVLQSHAGGRGIFSFYRRDDENQLMKRMGTNPIFEFAPSFGGVDGMVLADFHTSSKWFAIVRAATSNSRKLVYIYRFDADFESNHVETTGGYGPISVESNIETVRFTPDGKWLLILTESEFLVYPFDADNHVEPRGVAKVFSLFSTDGDQVTSFDITGDLSEGDDPDPVPDDDPYYVLATFEGVSKGLEIRHAVDEIRDTQITLDHVLQVDGSPTDARREKLQMSPHANYIAFNHYTIEGTTSPSIVKWNENAGTYEPMPVNMDDPYYINHVSYVSNDGLVVGHKISGSGGTKLKIFKDTDGTLNPVEEYPNVSGVFASPDCRYVLYRDTGGTSLMEMDSEGQQTNLFPLDNDPASNLQAGAVSHDGRWAVIANISGNQATLNVYRRDDQLGMLVSLDTSSFPVFNTNTPISDSDPPLFITPHPSEDGFIVAERATGILHWLAIDPDSSGDILLKEQGLSVSQEGDTGILGVLHQVKFSPDGKFLLMSFRPGNAGSGANVGGLYVFNFDAEATTVFGDQCPLGDELDVSNDNQGLYTFAIGQRGVDLDISH